MTGRMEKKLLMRSIIRLLGKNMTFQKKWALLDSLIIFTHNNNYYYYSGYYRLREQRYYYYYYYYYCQHE